MLELWHRDAIVAFNCSFFPRCCSYLNRMQTKKQTNKQIPISGEPAMTKNTAHPDATCIAMKSWSPEDLHCKPLVTAAASTGVTTLHGDNVSHGDNALHGDKQCVAWQQTMHCTVTTCRMATTSHMATTHCTHCMVRMHYRWQCIALQPCIAWQPCLAWWPCIAWQQRSLMPPLQTDVQVAINAMQCHNKNDAGTDKLFFFFLNFCCSTFFPPFPFYSAPEHPWELQSTFYFSGMLMPLLSTLEKPVDCFYYSKISLVTTESSKIWPDLPRRVWTCQKPDGFVKVLFKEK